MLVLMIDDIFIELKDTFFKVHSLDEPSVVDLRKVPPHMDFDDLISVESSLDLSPTFPFHPLLLPSSFFTLLQCSQVYFCRV